MAFVRSSSEALKKAGLAQKWHEAVKTVDGGWKTSCGQSIIYGVEEANSHPGKENVCPRCKGSSVK